MTGHGRDRLDGPHARTPVATEPFRAELLSIERLAAEAREIGARQASTTQPPIRSTPLIALVRSAAADLAADNTLLAAAVRDQLPVSPASEWLLDNYYLIEEQIAAVGQDLPAGYGVELPRLTNGVWAGYPRIFHAIVELVSHTDSRLDEEYLLRFIQGFQEAAPLSIGEAWAVPIMLRIALIENLCRLSSQVTASYRSDRNADEWAERLLLAGQDHPEEMPALFHSLDEASSTAPAAFFVRLAQRLQGMEAGIREANEWLDRTLGARSIDLESAAQEHQQLQAANQVSIANAITSVRFLQALDWRSFFEAISVVERTLREDPADVYARMDFASRDRLRHSVEGMAKRCRLDEVTIAESALQIAREALDRDPTDTARGHVGYYLVSDGRYEFENRVGYRTTFRERLYRGPLRAHGLIYAVLFGGLTLLFSALVAWWASVLGASGWRLAIVTVLSLLPMSEIAMTFTNRTLAGIYAARPLLKLDFTEPVAEAHRTLVIVPALLSSVPATQSVIDNLEVAYLANRDPNVVFGLLGDLRAADEPLREGDSQVVETAVRGISALNERYAAEHGVRPFHLFIRGRTYNEAEQTWMGWERKRGALVELVRLLRGSSDTSFTHKLGDAEFRRTVTFVITLDADTILPRDGAGKLIATIAHPLNRARWRPGDPRVRAGYGLVQPRVSMTLPGSHRSRFAWMYSGTTGIDPYVGAASDTYQDVFGEGSFTGKGIFEVSLFGAVLEDRFPDNSLLSHDLVEGSFLRTALASDVEVLDDYPPSYMTDISRVHRWIRGDWQTLPWLGWSVKDARGRWVPNPLSGLARWKITDNLRRSMFAPAVVILATVGWLLIPQAALWWPTLALAIMIFPVVFGFADAVLMRPRSVPFRVALAAIGRDTGRDLTRGLFEFTLVPYRAQVSLDAAARALWRMGITRRGLLEWETAADAHRRMTDTPRNLARRMAPAMIASTLLLAFCIALDPARAWVALPLAAIWLAEPLAAWRVSQPSPELGPEPLTPAQQRLLRRAARKTWRFFETFVRPEGHYLVPDNFQEDPKGEVAWRTSPTNMGLQLLAYLTSYDLGYVTTAGLLDYASNTLASMAGLDRFKGHFYNWYDIKTLQPLPPTYVSTVDSGNLAGHLLVLRIGLLEASESPVLGPQLLEGLRDTVLLALEEVLAEQATVLSPESAAGVVDALQELERELAIERRPGTLAAWSAFARRICTYSASAVGALGAPASASRHVSADAAALDLPLTAGDRVRAAVAAVDRETNAIAGVLESLTPWAPLLDAIPSSVATDERCPELVPLREHVPSLVGLAEGLAESLAALDDIARNPRGANEADRAAASEWASELAAGIRDRRPAALELLSLLRLNADIARQMWEHTDFTVLFDPRRELFSIGYNTAEGQLDRSYYDMLASECRLASFLAIAKGDAPEEHWFRLGRLITSTGTGRALVSWSASMFEYLMPLLVMRSWPNTLLDETYAAVVRRQVQYGRDRGVPWGVSESAFNAKDASLVYQYQAFGVPGLGLKRGLSDDVVIAPYASLLALAVDPHTAIDNLAALKREGAEGRWGYYESIDFTPGRVPAGQTRAIVKAYFAHHTGMGIVALGNEINGGVMQRRFHSDPLVESAELLLQERVPRHVVLTSPHVEEVRFVRSLRQLPPPVIRSYPTADTPVPATHFLSNGRYSVMVTNGGGGYSRWMGRSVTRYREDVTRDCWGTFFYVKDVDSGHVFSATHQPHPSKPDEYHVTFAPDKAEYRRTDGELETHVEVAVSPEDDIEVRRLTITNTGREPRTLEATSYFEIALTAQGADQAHKSFSNLFVETEVLPETRAVLFSRRPRSEEEERVWGLHLTACDREEECAWSFETDRAAFLGRLRGVDDPAALDQPGALAGGVGAVLDPSCSLRRRIVLGPGESARLVFVTGVAEEREAAVRLTEKYSDPRSAQRAIDLAWTSAQLELRDLGITPEEAIIFERLASRLLLTDPASRLKVKTPSENGLPISGLWSIGISGDFPILLVRVDELEHAPLVRQAILAHQYWRHKGLTADLVVLNTRPTGYSDELDERLRLLMRTAHALQLVDKPGGIFLRRSDQMHSDVLNLLLTVARATLDGDGGPIDLQLARRGKREEEVGSFVPSRAPSPLPTAPEFARPALLYDNGFGGFDPETGEYVIVLEGGQTTPAPWVNVIAGPEFGCMVSEAGVGCTWALNSHENRITTWNNDPVSDGSGEAIYVRDEDTGEFWSPTPLPVRDEEPFVIRHGRGYSRFEHTCHGIAHELDWFVPMDEPLRVCRLRLTNRGAESRRLSVTQFVEWVLGDSRSRAQHLVVTWFDGESDILTAHNHFNQDFPGRCAFVAADRRLGSYTASRTEFVGRNGRPCDPAALHRKGLGGVTGRFYDNCGALQVPITVEPGDTAEVSFLLGQTASLEECRELVRRYREPGTIDGAFEVTQRAWSDIVESVTVDTPDERLDLLVNGALLYQTLSCRIWGRTAAYQSGGAFGFRDQLQDVMALLLVRPDLARAQIVEAARRQFERGDVLHWWQPPTGRGVRTRFSDDRHWMPLVVAEYLRATGDTSVLSERIAFIDGPELAAEQEDLYLQPTISERAATVYEHCIAALESGRATGPHGLPLIGGGDWNDGMNHVGRGGRGESVWLAWFLAYVLRRFADVSEISGEPERAAGYLRWADELVEAVDREAWDGSWYRRAYFDDGTPLGSKESEECRIDAIAQAWATITGGGDPRRARTALDSAEERLIRRDDGLIALLTPPFDRMTHDPGYIKGYLPGVRENGGQYTHAALWVVLAYILQGDGDEALDLIDLINPISHARSRADAVRYAVEPYVVAADVYAVEPHVGRGGWTWYTGSASWFYRVAVNYLLGLRVEARDAGFHLIVDPCIPKNWPGFTMTYRRGTTLYRIRVDNPRGVNRGVAHMDLDGVRYPDASVPLHDDGGEHEVVVALLGG